MDSADNTLARETYRQLRLKVGAKFDDIARQNVSQMACRKGCHQCCIAHLSVFKIERDHIAEFLQSSPKIAQAIAANNQRVHKRQDLCRYLDENGGCLIYQVRPLICMSHGVPIKWQKTTHEKIKKEPLEKNESIAPDQQPEKNQSNYDVCPLNFVDIPLAQLPEQAFIDIDTLNTLLSLLNRQYTADKDDHRYALEKIAHT